MSDESHGRLSPRDLLTYFGVPDHPRVFVLGCLEQRVTIHDQQVRAANLVWALAETKLVRPGQSLAIVGAGFAGLTAAAAAKRIGLEPVVYEYRPCSCLDQRDSPRWIHPRIYDWPERDSKGEHLVPFMCWTPDRARDVVAKMDEIVTEHQFLPKFETKVVGLKDRATEVELVTQKDRGGPLVSVTVEPPETHAAVILALGFGLEPMHGYWKEDLAEQEGLTPIWYVSGLGDGALIDVARLRLGSKSHDFYELLQAVADQTPELARTQLLDLERHARNEWRANRSGQADQRKQDSSRVLADGIRRILDNVSAQLQPLKQTIEGALRADHTHRVYLVGRQVTPYGLGSSILNRWVLALLLAWDERTEYAHGKLRPVDDELDRFNPKQTVSTLSDGAAQYIIRHGPKRPLPYFDPETTTTKHLHDQVGVWLKPIYQALRERPAPLLDGPRHPQWPTSYWPDTLPAEREATCYCTFVVQDSSTAPLVELQVRYLEQYEATGLPVILWPDAEERIKFSEIRRITGEHTKTLAADSSTLVPTLRYYEAQIALDRAIPKYPEAHLVRNIDELLAIREIRQDDRA